MESEIAANSGTVSEECAAEAAAVTLSGRIEPMRTLGFRWKSPFGVFHGTSAAAYSYHRSATGEAYRYQ
jgi:hypothetical protein